MNNRNTTLALLFVALLLEGLLLSRSGLGVWLTSKSHSAEEWRNLLFDWRMALSVGLVTIIMWLGFRWFRLGAADKNHHTKD